MTPRPQPRTDPCDRCQALNRFAQAEAFFAAADLVVADDSDVAYPGVWLREDVYALHGHYSDLHATVPTFERIAAGAMARFVVARPGERAQV